MAGQYYTIPSASASANPSVGTNGQNPAPTSSTEVAGINPSGALQPLKTDASGNLLVDVASPINLSENLAQVNGQTVNVGIGAAGTGTQRVAVSSDSIVQVAGLNPSNNPQELAVSYQGAAAVSTIDIGNSGSISGTGATVALSISGHSSMLVGLTGTWTGQVNFQYFDGNNYIPAYAQNTETGTFVNSTTTNGSFKIFDIAGYHQVVMQGASWVSGTANVFINASTGVSNVEAVQLNAVNLNATVVGQAAAGTPSGGVLSVQGASGGFPIPISGSITASALPLPSGAATAANQTTMIADLAQIVTNTGAQATDVVNTGTALSALNAAVTIAAQGVYTVTFSVVGTFSATLVVEGQTPDNNWTQLPINIVSSILPYQQMPSITVPGTFIATVGGFTNVRMRVSAYTSGTATVAVDGSLAQQTVIANVNTPDLTQTGASAQTAVVNNILSATSGAAGTFVGGFHSASVQVNSTGTSGTFIFEGSLDNVNWSTIGVYNQAIYTGTPITAAITATASNIIYTFPIQINYFRLRIATAITGGSIQAYSRFSQTPWSPAVFQVAQATAANLATTSVISSGTVTTVGSVTSSNTAIPGIIADVASAAITTTTTTAAFTPTAGQSYSVQIPVTVVSGTSPTLSTQIQESMDSGTNWFTVYTFPTITAVGSYTSPCFVLQGNRVRYVQTVTGTTPSFTRAINRLQGSGATFIRPTANAFTDRSGTIAVASTSQTLAPANPNRQYFLVQNLSSSANLFINFTTAASATNSILLLPYASWSMESSSITNEQINIFSTTAAAPFVAKEM